MENSSKTQFDETTSRVIVDSHPVPARLGPSAAWTSTSDNLGTSTQWHSDLVDFYNRGYHELERSTGITQADIAEVAAANSEIFATRRRRCARVGKSCCLQETTIFVVKVILSGGAELLFKGVKRCTRYCYHLRSPTDGME